MGPLFSNIYSNKDTWEHIHEINFYWTTVTRIKVGSWICTCMYLYGVKSEEWKPPDE